MEEKESVEKAEEDRKQEELFKKFEQELADNLDSYIPNVDPAVDPAVEAENRITGFSAGLDAFREAFVEETKKKEAEHEHRTADQVFFDEMNEVDYIPRAWTRQFKAGSLKRAKMTHVAEYFKARLLVDPSFCVLVKTSDPQSSARHHEDCVVERLAELHRLGDWNSGHVVAYYEKRSGDGLDFSLMEAGGKLLSSFVESSQEWLPIWQQSTTLRRSDKLWQRPLKLNQSLPLFIDILRGISDLESAGAVHAGLTCDYVIIKEGRAIVSGLEAACLLQSSDSGALCETLKDTDSLTHFTQPCWQPPEVTDGSPTGTENHAWTAGLLFAFMNLGYNPSVEVAMKKDAWLLAMDDSMEMRMRLREILRQHFKIEEDPNFDKLGEGEKRVLKGMVEPDLSKRWSVAKALAEAEKLAAAEGIEVPARRESPVLPVGWKVEADSIRLDRAPTARIFKGMSETKGEFAQEILDDAWN